MKHLAWLTDIHLNFLRAPALEAFLAMLAETEADAFAISGDIAEADDVAVHLHSIAERVNRPVYFVLGNHDFYRGSIAAVREQVRALCSATPNLHWMADAGVVPFTDEACLIGHDGWGDGRFGDYNGSPIMLNDWRMIQEFAGLDKQARLAALNAVGDESAAHLRRVLPDALARFQHVVVVTHLPPFREACWHEGRLSDDDWLPHFTCKAVGDALIEAMSAAPDRRMTVLCGHTHGGGEAQILPNHRVLTGGASYGQADREDRDADPGPERGERVVAVPGQRARDLRRGEAHHRDEHAKRNRQVELVRDATGTGFAADFATGFRLARVLGFGVGAAGS